MNAKLAGVTFRVTVGAAASVNVTVTVRVIPPPEIVRVSVFTPATAVAVFTLTAGVPLFEPEVGVTVSQLTFLLTVHA
ncbi:MAG: hypothetical protein ABL960_09870, partial [Nitrospira sp.]